MPATTDVLIVGGGVIGLTTAYYLAGRMSARVTVLDRGPLGREASWAGAGIVPPAGTAPAEAASTPFDRLRAFSTAVLPELTVELRASTGLDNGYRVCGGVEFPADERIDTAAWTREAVEWKEVRGDELRRVEPALATGLGPAYFLPRMAQIRNPQHLQALVVAAAGRGVEFRPHCPAVVLERDGRRIAGVATANGPLTADRVLICAGAWTDTLLAPLGCTIESRPVRGQIALLRCATPVLRRVVLAGKRYVVPRDDGRVLVGSTEEDAGFDPSTTAEAIGDLLAFATGLAPALGRAPVERCWAGLRPGSPDGLPTLGPVPGFDNLWVAAGHFRAGLQLSAATGLLMAEAVTGHKPTIPLDPFRVDRPPGPAVRPAFRS